LALEVVISPEWPCLSDQRLEKQTETGTDDAARAFRSKRLLLVHQGQGPIAPAAKSPQMTDAAILMGACLFAAAGRSP
jgi:hypothetical protein